MDIINSLKTLGLNEKEAKAYNALLLIRKGSVSEIARKAEIKRPTAYFVLEELRNKKLITHTLFRGVKDYRVSDPENIKKYIEQQQKAYEKNKQELENLYAKRKNKMRLRVYRGAGSIKTLLEKVLREKSILYIIGNRNNFSENLELYWDYFLKKSGQLNVAPIFKNTMDKNSLLIWSDKIAFIDFTEEIHLFAFKNIHLNNLYRKIWKNY